MHLAPRRLAASALVALCVAALPARAQSAAPLAGPHAGTWGAEANVAGGSEVALLRFSSPDAAWLVGAFANVSLRSDDNVVVDVFGNPSVRTESYTAAFAQLRAGRRWYRADAREQLRPIVGVGLIGMYSGARDSRYWSAGGYGEMGAAYFFTPHLSLDASGQLAVVRNTSTQSSSTFSLRQRDWSLSAQLLRLGGAVYF